ncbi:MAG: putative molybdenum carrier protein [Thermoanaerobaculum sp.]
MKVISGGQTGVDRAALDAALELGLPCGGFCPRGRRAEDGRIPDRYPLVELASPSYAARTWANVRAADATLVLASQPLSGGTRLTVEACQRLGKPFLVVDPTDPQALERTTRWLRQIPVAVLNVAGPRESQRPGIYACALAFLRALFASLA